MRIEFHRDHEGKPVGRPATIDGSARRPTGDTIVGVHVRLERLSANAHAQHLFEEFAAQPDDGLWTYMGQGPFRTAGEFVEWVRGVESSTDPHFYAIVDTTSNRAVGVASYLRIDPTNRSIEVGWLTFAPALQRTRGATEAMYLMARQAFDLGFHRYEWKCNALNAPSIAAAERLGFSFEGVFRDAVVVKGRHRDTAWFAFTAQDWPTIRAAHESWLAPENFDDAGNQRSSLRNATEAVLHNRWPNLTVEITPAPER